MVSSESVLHSLFATRHAYVPAFTCSDGLRHQLVHLGADLLFRDGSALGGKIGHHLANHIGVAALAEFGRDDCPGVGIGGVAG